MLGYETDCYPSFTFYDIEVTGKRGKNMRLIDADALIDLLDVGHLRPPTEICFSELMMKNIIELMPTVDAVPVIRCRECLYQPHCESYIITQKEDAFCSWADREVRG